MQSLLDFQRAMRDAALGGGSHFDFADWVKAPQDLSIHHNNTQLGLSEVLASLYPVTVRLVGNDFFGQMALGYMRTHPPENPALLYWGQDFPGFISTYEPCRSLPYLADVARLEAAWNKAYHATEATPIDPSILMQLPQDKIEQVLFVLHPSLRLIASTFPIHAIWQANQPDSHDESVINLDAGGTTIVVARPWSDVIILSLSNGAFAFIMALQCGQNLSVAWDAARAVQPDFSLVQELGALLAAGLFTEAYVP